MKIAIISDIHSNIHALEAALKDIDKQKVDLILSTGDLVGYLYYPNEVIKCLQDHHIKAIMGNHDQGIANSQNISQEEIDQMDNDQIQFGGSKTYTNHVISEENRQYLQNLPGNIKMDVEGHKLLLVHGSPNKIDEYLSEESQVINELAEEIKDDIIVFGHTHIPFVKTINNKTFVNAGSVGKPKHGSNQGTYIILDIKEDQVKVDIKKFIYDINSVIESILSTDLITDKLIDMIKEGK